MDIQITKLDGTSYFLSDYDIQVINFVPESIEYDDKYVKVEGIHGRYLVDSVYVKRKINVSCLFVTDNNEDYVAQRTLLYDLVQDTQPFYIRELRKRHKDEYGFCGTNKMDAENRLNDDKHYNDFVDGKRYLVKLSNVLKPTQTHFSGNVDIEFETVKLPFAESIGTSTDLENRLTDGMWSDDMQINFDDYRYTKYTFNDVSAGDVYYHGNVAIDQFNMHAVVKIVVGENTELFKWAINDEVMYIRYVPLKRGDVLVYDGLKVYRNGKSILSNTGLTMPHFKPGFNHFKFNQNVKAVHFDLRFYFK